MPYIFLFFDFFALRKFTLTVLCSNKWHLSEGLGPDSTQSNGSFCLDISRVVSRSFLQDYPSPVFGRAIVTNGGDFGPLCWLPVLA